MSTPFYDTDLTDAAWAWVAPFCRLRKQAGDLGPPSEWCHENFHRGARSAITFKAGKGPACGSIYIACSTSSPVVLPDGQLVHRW